jgi:hypothetical protein
VPTTKGPGVVRFLHGTAIRGTAAAQDKVKIDFITTLSGPAGIIGKHMKDSVELALDHLGRKVGRRVPPRTQVAPFFSRKGKQGEGRPG